MLGGSVLRCGSPDALRSDSRPGHHRRGQLHGLDETPLIRHSLLDDVEPGAVVHRSADEGQAQGHIHGTTKGEKLDGYQALVVVSRNNRIEIPSGSPREQAVGRQRAHDIEALGAEEPDGRDVYVLLLAPEQPSFAGVRVQATEGDPTAAGSQAGKLAVDQADHATNQVGRQSVGYGPQRLVDRQQRHAKPSAHEHHGHVRHPGLRGQHLGVTRPRVTCGMKRLLVQWRRDKSIDAVLERVVGGNAHSFRRRSAACGRDSPEGDGGVRGYVHDTSTQIARALEAEALRPIREALERAIHGDVGLGTLVGREGPQYHLGTDPGGITDRQCEAG